MRKFSSYGPVDKDIHYFVPSALPSFNFRFADFDLY